MPPQLLRRNAFAGPGSARALDQYGIRPFDEDGNSKDADQLREELQEVATGRLAKLSGDGSPNDNEDHFRRQVGGAQGEKAR